MVTAQAPTQVISGDTANVVSGPRAGVKYTVEAIGTFFLVFTVGVTEPVLQHAFECFRNVDIDLGERIEKGVRASSLEQGANG
jgi:hypothetical protein